MLFSRNTLKLLKQHISWRFNLRS